MKKLFILFCASGVLLNACSNNTNEKTTTTNDSVAGEQTIPKPENFYKRLEGIIAGKPVVMHLHKTGNTYDVQYTYEAMGMFINLMTDSISKDSIYFSEYVMASYWDNSNEHQSPQLRVALTNNTLKGIWVSGDGKKTYPIDLKENYPEGSYSFDMIAITDSAKAFPEKPTSPMAHTSYSFVVPISNDWIGQEIRHELEFNKTMMALDYKTGVDTLNKEYFKKYRSEVGSLPEDLQNDGPSMNYELMVNIGVRYNQNGFVVLESLAHEFTGGAHGNSYCTYSCLDVPAQKKLSLKDVVSADSVTLQPIVEQYFCKQYHVNPDSISTVLFENHLATNENFYLTNKGIGFLYNPYEVASYAQGQINVFIPFTAIDKYLTPAFKKRIGY